jgi:hypothetical protein
MFYYFVFPFAYNYLYIIFKLIILFVYLNRLFISLVAIDPSCKTYVENDLISLHYVTFIELLAICPTETLSFDSDQFTNNSINEVIEEKTNDPFLLLEEHFFTAFLVYKKLMNYNLKIYRMKFSTPSQRYMEQKLFIPQHHTGYQLAIYILISVFKFFLFKLLNLIYKNYKLYFRFL